MITVEDDAPTPVEVVFGNSLIEAEGGGLPLTSAPTQP